MKKMRRQGILTGRWNLFNRETLSNMNLHYLGLLLFNYIKHNELILKFSFGLTTFPKSSVAFTTKFSVGINLLMNILGCSNIINTFF